MSSRHEAPAKVPGYIVSYGWDFPLNTYFCQVQPTEDDAESILWLGGERNAITDPMQMVAPLERWFDLTPAIIQQLRDERAADLDRRPSPIQRLDIELTAINNRIRRQWLG